MYENWLVLKCLEYQLNLFLLIAYRRMVALDVAVKGQYCKNSKNWDTWNNYHTCPTIGTVGFYSAVLSSKDADRITNRVDPDQTAPWGAVWSGPALFAQSYLSQYFKLLRYFTINVNSWNTVAIANTLTKYTIVWDGTFDSSVCRIKKKMESSDSNVVRMLCCLQM